MMCLDEESLTEEGLEPDCNSECESALSASDFDALDFVYSSRIRALSSKASLIQQGCTPLDADEILQILRVDPDVFSDAANGHCVGSNDIDADSHLATHETASDPLMDLSNSTRSFLHRYAADNDFFVADNAAWVKGFDPVAFNRHVERNIKSRRYHGIDDIVLDKAGRVRSIRKLVKQAA